MPRRKRPRLTYSQRRGARSPQIVGTDQAHPAQGTHDEGLGPVAPGTKPGARKVLKSIQPEGQRKATTPGELVASTPILRRARGKMLLSPTAPVPELDLGANSQAGSDRGQRTKTSSSAQRRLDDRLVSLRERTPAKYADLEAVYRSFEALLKATAAGPAHTTRGPRSFLDMCLRKVPQYIAELEAWERLDAEESGTVSTLDDINTSADIYNELESLGTNVGWRHLRVVVRADGLMVVRQGIEEGLFGDEFSQLIIDLCIQVGATSEAEDLITALVDRQYPRPSSTESRFSEAGTLQPLVWLNSFTNQTQRTPFLLQQYSMLLSSGSLPVDWLATTELERLWSLAVQGLASTNHNYDAISFIATSISLLSSRKHVLSGDTDALRFEQDMAKASQRTLTSALGILASMSLLGEAELNESCLPESDARRVTVIGDKLRYVMRACIHELEGHARSRGGQRLKFLYLALFLSSGHNQGEKIGSYVRASIEKLSPTVATKDIRTSHHYDSIAWLIASIARACSRGTSIASRQYLDGLFKRLEGLDFSRHLLDTLKAASAFSIAQQTNNVRDLIYAESLHSHSQSSPDAATSNQQNDGTLFTGYRWDETIGEWVTVSPVANKRRSLTSRRRLRSPISAEGAESLVTGPSDATSLVTDSVSDAETRSNYGTSDGGDGPEERTRTCNSQGMMMKKRPRRLQSTEALSTTWAAKVSILPQSKSVVSASSGLLEGQDDPDKENRVRFLAKKPRRSSGRIVLATRSPSRDILGRRDKYSRDGAVSEDELSV